MTLRIAADNAHWGDRLIVSMNKIIKALALAALLLVVGSGFAAEQSPGQAYLEYHSVLKKSHSAGAIWPYHIKSAQQNFERKFPPSMRSRAFYIMKSSAPATVEVAAENIDGDSATLVLIPTSSSQADRGDAIMRLEDGTWKVEKVVWRVP